MSDHLPTTFSPVLVVTAPAGQDSGRGRGGPANTRKPTRSRQGERLDERFDELQRLISGDTAATVGGGLLSGDPELVIVFEVIDASVDLHDAFALAGLELMVDIEDEIDDDDLGEDFARVRAPRADAEAVKRYLHAAMANEEAVRQLLSLWSRWKSSQRMTRGFGAFSKLFERLSDVRRWGPVDRVRTTGLAKSLAEAVEAGLAELPLNIELFFRQSETRRRQAEQVVGAAVMEAGGRVLATSEHPEIGYHAIAAVLPPESLGGAELDLEYVALLRAPDVLLVRPAGQSIAVQLPPDLPVAEEPGGAAGLGPPLVAMLDGLPETNHPLLRNRVLVVDPDGVAGDATYTTVHRRHGTMVASALVWGDRGHGHPASARLIVARPVMKPDLATLHGDESIPWEELPADLTIRAVRDVVAQVPTIRIINLSLGDPLAQFDSIPSGWARAIDWLAHEHNLLFIVSAGNHLTNLPINATDLRARTGDERDQVTVDAIATLSPQRRLLPPGESLNAVTVGAIHADAAGDGHALGYRLDVWSEPGQPSPVTAHGRGIRRSIKPDIAAPGGRQLYDEVVGHGELAISRAQATPPGVEVAAPPDRRAFVSGTTFAAAEVSRRAALIMESLANAPTPVGNDHLVVGTKALLVHGAQLPAGASYGVATDRLVGHGTIERDLALGCASNQATMLFVGELAAQQQTDLVVPFPATVAGRTEVKRLTATLAWLSPINWNHRQYRRAKLSLDGPAEMTSGRANRGVRYHLTRRGSLEHRVFDTSRAYAAPDLTFRVKCVDQAGGFQGTVVYAVAVSLEVGVNLAIDVYELVRQELATRVRV